MSSALFERTFIDIPRSAWMTSLIIHGAIALGFITVQILAHFNIHPFPKKRIQVEPYDSLVQVDIVSLPDTSFLPKVGIDPTQKAVDQVKEAAPLPKAAEEMVAPTHDKAAKEKQTPKDQEKKESRSEQMKALKELQEEAKREQALNTLRSKGGKKGKEGRKKMAGNILSQGTAATGAIGTPKDRYVALVTQAIKDHFSIFPWQKKKGLFAVVYIEIYPTGRLRERRLVQPSTDPSFDGAVMEAVQAAQPLPVPDDPSLIREGITIEFRPEG